MMQVLISIAAFIVALGVMVTVHEYGHYWVARRCGVRVLRFSVGFGRPLCRWTRGVDRTEWMIAAIPLGGYVKMLDEREGEVDPGERHRAFNRQSVGKRAAIVAAGPSVNVLLAAIAYSLMFMIGVQGVVPRVGDIAAGSPAAEAGFERGDRMITVDGVAVPTWSEARLVLLDRGLSGSRSRIPITVERTDGGRTERRLDISGVSLEEASADPVRDLGFGRWLPHMPARITGTLDDSPAAAAGFQAGDRVVRVDDTSIDGWRAWVDYVRAHPGEPLEVTVLREGRRVELELTPATRSVNGRTIGRIGARGPTIDRADRDRMFTTVRLGPLDAVARGMHKTWEMTSLTVRMLAGLVLGDVALSNISGPVSIAQFAGQSAQIGLATFIGFIGLISISIGILNLLPIPVLDGGHLLYYMIEAIKGSPVSEHSQLIGQKIGLSLLFALMALAFYNDFVRLVY